MSVSALRRGERDEVGPSGRRAAVLAVAVVALGAGLRFWAVDRAPGNPFYDAAVRSMGLSWHNFFFGALEPGGSVSIDKPPADLWLQVASTKLLGFTTFALHLPEALGGAATVALLYASVRSVYGWQAGFLAGAALAVLPISVLTARSDTMDSVMTALLVGALWASVRGLQTRRAVWVLTAAGLVGLAFNVKLAEALVALPALAAMWVAAAGARRRPLVLAGAAVALVGVGLSWIAVASLTPPGQRPYPIGSGTGSIFRVVFVFNGVGRVSSTTLQRGPSGPTLPGPLRLLGTGGGYGQLIGVELVAAIALAVGVGAVAVMGSTRNGAGRSRRGAAPGADRAARWTTVGFVLWLAAAVVLLSALGHLQTRYLEAGSPAIAAVLGICAAGLLRAGDGAAAAHALAGALTVAGLYAVGVAGDWTGRMAAGLGLALALAGVLGARRAASGASRPSHTRLAGRAIPVVTAIAVFALPLRASLDLVDRGASDASQGGAGADYSAFLRAHRAHAAYETASDNTLGVVGLIAADGQPVLILNDLRGPLVRLATLRGLVGRGAVRYILLDEPCMSRPRCPATTRWSLRHARRLRGYLYGFTYAPARPAA